MPLDVGVFDKIKTFDDYQRAEEEFQLKKQLQAAQIAKAGQLDVGDLGERAFLKASQGMPLNSQEAAALQYLDAKSPTAAFNPVTGVLEQKPSLLQRAGLTFEAPQAAPNIPASPMPSKPVVPTQADITAGDIFQGQESPQEPDSEWDVAFQNEMAAAGGNPKLQQTIRENYAKAKLNMTESEAKNATYADRFRLAEPVLTDQNKIKAYASPSQRFVDWINPFGDQLNSDDYKSYNQARKNATTAKLRQESGATISPSEFKTDDETLYPQINDAPALIEQKRQGREAVRKGLQRAAGPAYKPVPVMQPQGGKLSGQEIDESIFNARVALRKGASADAVRQKLEAAGIDPKKAGL